jgi:HECT-domain (ubiquitin-transferase)/SPRY domain
VEESISRCILCVANDTTRIVHEEGFAVCLLYLRKLIFHILVTSGNNFELSFFGAKENFEIIRNFWLLIESFVSLRSAGWVGEAGAMAIAAEALGLGISSTEHLSKVSQNNRLGIAWMNIGEQLLSIPIAGLSQFLSTIQIIEGMRDGAVETYMTLAASAEACLGSEGSSGSLVFIQQGLQSAMCNSEVLVSLVVAAIRRSVRLLAVVDFSGDDSLQYDSLHDDENSFGTMTSKGADDDQKKETMNSHQADARLACFLTGIVLSNPVLSCLRNKQKVFEGLLEAWNIGLLSGSVPWRMVSALTAAGIINKNPSCFSSVGKSSKLVKNFYSRLQSIVVRRIWAERAAFPICSKYVQALLELLTSVRIADPDRLTVSWGNIEVDAATPLPINTYQLNQNDIPLSSSNWEWDEGWVANDTSWEVWVGTAQFTPLKWKVPARSAVRSLMDGGEGPPMLGEGDVVMRGVDWPEECDDDGKSEYEREKADKEKEKKAIEEKACNDPALCELESVDVSSEDLKDLSKVENVLCQSSMLESNDTTENSRKKRRKKSTNPRLPIGTVISIESWNGIPAMARRVRWHLTEKESVYRYGGDGGRYDLCHVEVNDKGTRIRKRHPLPESMEQCVARHGFGAIKKYSVLLRLRRDGRMEMNDSKHNGLLEWPDFGAGISVDCFLYEDGSVMVREGELIFGSKDSGWEARFGQPSYRAGTEIILAPNNSSFRDDIESSSCDTSFYEEISGTRLYVAEALRNKSDGSKINMKFEMSMIRGHRSLMTSKSKFQLSCFPQPPPPICFDRDCHASSMSLSRDCRTLTCTSPDGRGTAFANVGFTKGVHYWEVKLEQADIGSVFVGVAEKPNASQNAGASSLNHDNTPRLNRWLGWGFVNFRATYAAGAERVYGAHCHNEDTVGVLLDCDAGRVSFFYDGMKFGEHILNDLGCAFENISPFGFNADGCGSGGLGQGSPSGSEVGRGGRLPAHGIVRPRALWPVIGLRNPGDRVTFSTKWLTVGGIEPSSVMRNILAVDEVLEKYFIDKDAPPSHSPVLFPDWFISEAFNEYRRWYSRRWFAATTRGSGPYRLAALGLDVELDCSPLACAVACAAIGLPQVLLPGDRVIVKRSAGRPLELVEEAEVLGTYQSRLFYKLVSQKSEGGSLTSGGGRAWFWDESEVVGDSIQIIGEGKGCGIELPRINRFKCLSAGGIKIVYEGGAVVRSDLEIFDRSSNLGTVPCNTVISRKNVLERRVNSCGVTRYRICFEGIGEGWISSRIRGGKEEPIVELVSHGDSIEDCEKDAYFITPEDAAMCWLQKFNEYGTSEEDSFLDSFDIKDVNMFQELVKSGVISGIENLESDSIVSALLSSISNFLHDGDALNSSFKTVALAVTYALTAAKGEKVSGTPQLSKGAMEAAATVLSSAAGRFSSEKALMARISVIRALNRRLRRALPWISVRPTQEGTSIFGGLCGQGASVERVGKRQLSDSMKLWVEVPCMASRMRLTKGLFLNNVKLGFLESVIHATETPTPLSHDEYELPREIRTVRVNRVKSRKVMSGSDTSLKRKHSVFAQLQNEMRTWGGAALRRGFVAKGHGGQKRAFKVKLIGEGVNDYSGPYREVFTDAISEIMEFDSHGRGYLGVLDPTPNHMNDIGEGRELFMFSRVENNINKSMAALIKVSPEECRIHKGFASLTLQRDEASREIEESVMILGRLVGTACRHGIPVDLSLPFGIVWSTLVEENLTDKARLEEIDSLASKICNDYYGSALLQWEQRMVNAFVDGISHVLPLELLPLLSKHELQDLFCGNPDVDVDLLKCVVEYEGYNENDLVILFFWEVLREMTNLDRKKFLQFVWARNRLPSKESDFESPFRIQRDIGSSDNSLPSASTCFFTLTLPKYSSKDVLREKLTFAMENVCTMESDYVTNDAEVGEGWRGM